MDKKKEIITNTLVRVGISIGDVNGIGPEVIMKALNDTRMLLSCTPIIYGSSKVLSFHKKNLDVRDFVFLNSDSVEGVKDRKINIVNLWKDEINFDLGKATSEGGRLAFESLEAATADLASGKIDVLVTAPISKDAMSQSGFKFPGHTEYLADMSGQEDALMLMVAPSLRIGLVTSHIPLKDVSTTLTADKVYGKIKSFAASLTNDFGIRRPKIAVFGVNPHAGESGKMGTEELESIIPGIDKAKSEGIVAFGPFPADGFFGSTARQDYDGVLAMYHDQGLAAFKALSFDEGVNFTAGLPIIRTSPDHGTAYDIVGQNKASGTSMRNAIYMAIDAFRNHKLEKEITANPLEAKKRVDFQKDKRK